MIALSDVGRQTGLAILTASSVLGLVVGIRLVRRYASFEDDGIVGNVVKSLASFLLAICSGLTLVVACSVYVKWSPAVAIGLVLAVKLLPWPKKRPFTKPAASKQIPLDVSDEKRNFPS